LQTTGSLRSELDGFASNAETTKHRERPRQALLCGPTSLRSEGTSVRGSGRGWTGLWSAVRRSGDLGGTGSGLGVFPGRSAFGGRAVLEETRPSQAQPRAWEKNRSPDARIASLGVWWANRRTEKFCPPPAPTGQQINPAPLAVRRPPAAKQGSPAETRPLASPQTHPNSPRKGETGCRRIFDRRALSPPLCRAAGPPRKISELPRHQWC